MSRSDLLIRASRHYEGAMLGFIRQATACFKNSSANYLNLKMIDQKVKNKYEWVEANSPARLDLGKLLVLIKYVYVFSLNAFFFILLFLIYIFWILYNNKKIN